MKSFVKEFKEFISKGNVMDMAVGVIIGGAFTAIVTSLVNDIIMPLLSLLTGGLDFSNLAIKLGEGEEAASLNYGAFIAAIINFLLIALILFIIIKVAMNASNMVKNATGELPNKEEKKQLKEQGVSFLFVSHNINQVKKLCQKALWIENSTIMGYGKCEDICNQYIEYCNKLEAK